MSQAIPIDTSLWGGSDALNSLLGEENAVSDEAREVSRAQSEVFEGLEHSESLFGTKHAALSELWEVAEECAEEGWDGEGAPPIEPWAVRLAERFIRVLPEDIPMPEPIPEPDGSIGLDWTLSPHQNLSVSFGANARLAYAWLDGSDRGHAVARFDGETIPRRILDGIRAIYRLPR
ncbi:MAG: hypothetical protein ACLFU6_08670 [Candidatus Hydrogenedentota bacterium]